MSDLPTRARALADHAWDEGLEAEARRFLITLADLCDTYREALEQITEVDPYVFAWNSRDIARVALASGEA